MKTKTKDNRMEALEKMADDLLKINAKIKKQTDKANKLKSQLLDEMQSRKIEFVEGSDSVAKITAGRKTTIIDVKKFKKLVTKEVFLNSVSVGVTSARKFAGDPVISQCSEIKQGSEYLTVKGK